MGVRDRPVSPTMGDECQGPPQRVGNFLARLASREDEVKRRCRTVLQ